MDWMMTDYRWILSWHIFNHQDFSWRLINHDQWSSWPTDQCQIQRSRLLAERKVADCNRHANLLNKSEHFFVFLHPSDWRIYSAFTWIMGHFCRIFFRLEELTKMSAKVLNVCYSIRASFKPRDVFTMVKCWDPTNPQISAVFFISPPKRKYTALQQRATTICFMRLSARMGSLQTESGECLNRAVWWFKSENYQKQTRTNQYY